MKPDMHFLVDPIDSTKTISFQGGCHLPGKEIVMTRLRQRMLEDMQLRGLSARTQGAYVLAVRQLAEHYQRSPDRITEEELRQYFLYLANEKRVARATATIALCGIRFFGTHTLRREWTTLQSIPSRRICWKPA